MSDLNVPCIKSAVEAELHYGETTLKIPFGREVSVLERTDTQTPLTCADVMRELAENSVMSDSLENVIISGKRVLVLLPDITRYSGAPLFLHEVFALIEKAGKDFSIMFATGTHRKQTEEESARILTPELYEKYKDRILTHDCDDASQLAFFGTSKAKTTIMVNKAYLEHDVIIPIASVSYHYFAGFGGGRKMIIPGIAGRKTAMMNHKLVLDPANKRKHPGAVTGNLRGNPVHEDLVTSVMITRARVTFYCINTIVDTDENVIDVVGGDLFMSHLDACERLQKYTTISVPEKFDALVVSCAGTPHDINMIQAQKCLDRACRVVKDGGRIIFLAESPDLYGNSDFGDFFDHGTPENMFDELMKDYRINRQTAFNLMSNNTKYDVHLLSRFTPEDCARMRFKHIASADDIPALLGGYANIGVIPNAYVPFFTAEQ